MTDEERRAAVMQLRELRTSPQALGRALRQSSAQKASEESDDAEEMTADGLSLSGASKPAKRKTSPVKSAPTSTKDLYKSLGL